MAALQAGRYLRSLLERSEQHRRRWSEHLVRDHGSLSTAAVCRVLAHHLWNTGERADTETDLARRLRDLVGRALSGEVLTRETCRWFVEAFELRPDERAALFAELARPPEDEGTLMCPPHVAGRAGSSAFAHVRHVVGWDGRVRRSEHVRVLDVGSNEPVVAVGRFHRDDHLELGADLRAVPTGRAGGMILCNSFPGNDEQRVVRWATERNEGATPASDARHVDDLGDLPCGTTVVTLSFEGEPPPWVELAVRAPDSSGADEIHILLPDDHGVVVGAVHGATGILAYSWLSPVGVSRPGPGMLRAAG